MCSEHTNKFSALVCHNNEEEAPEMKEGISSLHIQIQPIGIPAHYLYVVSAKHIVYARRTAILQKESNEIYPHKYSSLIYLYKSFSYVMSKIIYVKEYHTPLYVIGAFPPL